MSAPTTRFFEQGTITFRRELAGGYFVLGIEAPKVATAAEPGQFAMLSVRPPGAPGYDPLLPRPFTFLRTRGRTIELFLRAVGRGTQLLSRSVPGERFTVLGPLGHGFRAPADPSRRPVFVAGGIGVAPFLHFAERNPGLPRPVLLYGGRGAPDVQLTDELGKAMDIEIATEDGSVGEKGRVTVLLERWLARGEPIELYTCGPEPMMAAVTRLAKGVPIQASLEARMACGIGVCRGCVVPVQRGGYIEVCVDGPVRDGHEVWG